MPKKIAYRNILIACVGNICRSPTAEALLKKQLPNHNITSAGIRALIGASADLQAIRIALQHGIIIAGHTAHQLTIDMCQAADLILVMETPHIDAIADILPTARSKTMLLGQWLPQKNIIDPFRKSDDTFEAVFQQIEAACTTWAEKLNEASA